MSYRAIKSEAFWAIVIVIGLALIAYSPGITFSGFYLDDWYILWAGRVFGPQMIADMHLFDRPLMGVVFAFYYRLFGENLFIWQMYMLGITIWSGLAVLRLGRRIWPDKRFETTVIALIFVLYPGFTQHPNAMTYANHISSHVFAISSILFTVEALTSKQLWKSILFHSLALIFAFVHVFYIEYMIGIEGLRFLLAWIIISKDPLNIQERLFVFARRTILYLVPTVTMIFWRLFIFESGRRSMNVGDALSGYTSSPSRALLRLVIEGGRDFIETTLFAWFVNAYNFLINAEYRELVLSIGLATIAVSVFIFFARSQKHEEGGHDSQWGRTLLSIGIVGVAFAILPVVAVGRNVELGTSFNSFNRYTIHAALSVSFVVVGFSEMFLNRTGRFFIFGLLIGLAIFTHYQSTLNYNANWEYQKNLWWQLSWRVPNIEEDTLLVIVLPRGLRFIEGYEIWAPANLIYRPGSQTVAIDGQLLNDETVGWFAREITDQPTIRGVWQLDRDYGNALIITIPNELSCMHVIGDRIDDSSEDPLVQQIAIRSNEDRIITHSEMTIPPQTIFGVEPTHTWCYYYQKISLANQSKDWSRAASLAQEAIAQDYKPLNRAEWMPVYEAFANIGELSEAKNIAKILKDDKYLRYHLCSQMTTLPESSQYNYEFIYSTLCGN
jgi:hypothetical protein